MDRKKDFQKVISKIRKDLGYEYPKAMMTGQQIRKNTATVNCGGEWLKSETNVEICDYVINDPRFISFLDRNHATAHLEPTAYGAKKYLQIRIHFQEV